MIPFKTQNTSEFVHRAIQVDFIPCSCVGEGGSRRPGRIAHDTPKQKKARPPARPARNGHWQAAAGRAVQASAAAAGRQTWSGLNTGRTLPVAATQASRPRALAAITPANGAAALLQALPAAQRWTPAHAQRPRPERARTWNEGTSNERVSEPAMPPGRFFSTDVAGYLISKEKEKRKKRGEAARLEEGRRAIEKQERDLASASSGGQGKRKGRV
ncbi:hypothetical protein THAOC_16657 [Thalassiosira oceanica]|uniref:Uncharacterized protein n=1 Tax=Thalassiosira oceanica TaxID=159749 RepID=K0SX02_THAOC|nr:hypothetical protein THAOC_16657 [Thalassiosira oceanica]|eukprot:EJK62717.1 hypothetical protein THAOC_16657 [Thalassiosira oceanica]